MKFAAPLSCLLLGIAIGWFAKPAETSKGVATSSEAAPSRTAEPSTAAKTATPEKALEPSSGPAKRPARPELSNSKDQAKIEEAGRKMQEQMGKRMVENQRKKFEARLAKLAAELNLSPDQQAKLRASMEDRLAKMSELFSGDNSSSDPKRFKDLGDLMQPNALDDLVAAQLTPDQKASHDALKAKERQSRIDAKALKDLGNLSSTLDLSQDQKDAVYSILAEQAAKKEDSEKNSNAMSAFTDGLGIQIDDELGISDFMQDSMNFEASGTQEKDIKKIMEESMRKRVNDRVEALRPVLNESQLQQYRAHLDSKASSWLNMMQLGTSQTETIQIQPTETK